MKINFQLSTEASHLLVQACQQLKKTPEDLLEELIVQLLRSPGAATTLAGLIGDKIRTMEKVHRTLKETAQLQEQLRDILV